MKATTLALALCLASFGASQVVPIGPFTGANVSDFEDQPLINSGDGTAAVTLDMDNLRINSFGSQRRLAVFDNANVDFGWAIYEELGDPLWYGFARDGKSFSGSNVNGVSVSPLRFSFKNLTSYGVLRFGGWFMMNDRTPVRFQFLEKDGNVVSEALVSGTATPSYQWFGWEVSDPFSSRITGLTISYSQPLGGWTSFHMDDFQWDVAPVPEPTTLIAFGAGVLALLRRRSRQ